MEVKTLISSLICFLNSNDHGKGGKCMPFHCKSGSFLSFEQVTRIMQCINLFVIWAARSGSWCTVMNAAHLGQHFPHTPHTGWPHIFSTPWLYHSQVPWEKNQPPYLCSTQALIHGHGLMCAAQHWAKRVSQPACNVSSVDKAFTMTASVFSPWWQKVRVVDCL